MHPVTFQVIEEAALLRHGSAVMVKRLVQPRSPAELKAIADDRYLSAMSRRLFQAGLKHELVDSKWPAFEAVFDGFDPAAVAAFGDERMESLLEDKRLIRHMPKLLAVRHNAAAMQALAAEHGSFARYLADWPPTDITGLWADLRSRMKQLGGNSTPYFLRMMGKDTFVPTDAVMRALAHWEAFEGKGTSKADQVALQAVFNRWHEETGKPFTHLSQILAMSVD